MEVRLKAIALMSLQEHMSFVVSTDLPLKWINGINSHTSDQLAVHYAAWHFSHAKPNMAQLPGTPYLVAQMHTLTQSVTLEAARYPPVKNLQLNDTCIAKPE